MSKVIVVQMGHVPPEDPFHKGQTGAKYEQEANRAVAQALVAILKKDTRFTPKLYGALLPRGTKADAAIFIHCDGGTNLSTGYCLGFPAYKTNILLASMMASEYDKIPGHPPHKRDNYTENMRAYYGYGRVDTSGPEVLHELGFVSNPKERAWIMANAPAIAHSHYVALCRYFGFAPMDSLPKKTGHWKIVRTFYDGHSRAPETSGSLRRWALRAGNLQKGGVRHVEATWVWDK